MQASRRVLAVALLLVTMASGCELLDDGPSARGAIEAPAPTSGGSAVTSPASPIVTPPALSPAAPPAATVAGTPSPTPAPTPSPTRNPTSDSPRPAASGYRRFTSTRLPYAIDYLETWQPAGGARFASGEGDLFSGGTAGSPGSHVTVVTLSHPSGTSPGLVFEAALAELAESGIQPTEAVERTVNGDEAIVFSYTLTRDGHTVAVTQAIVARPDTAWVLTLTTTPAEVERLAPVFSHMVDSLQVLG
jgi:hypothetical protein